MRSSLSTLGLAATLSLSGGALVVACGGSTGGGTSGGTSGMTSGGTSGTTGAPDSGLGDPVGPDSTSGGVDGGGDSGPGDVDAAGSDAGDAGTPAVQLIGRFDNADPAGPRFAWPGSRIIARFDGTAVSVKLTQTNGFTGGPTYFDVVVDGVVGAPFSVQGTATQMLASGLSAGPHTIEIMKRTEAVFGTVRFEGFTFTGGSGLLAPPARPARKMEFLGDSTIDGYGIEGDHATTCMVGGVDVAPPQYDEARKSVAWLTSVGIGAELNLLGYSGKGLARNEDGQTTDTFPTIYTRTLPDVGSSAWAFASFVPDAIVSALGGADYSGDPAGTFPANFDATYATMVADIRAHYGATPYVFLLVWSQYKSYDNVRQTISAAIDAAIAGRPAGEKNFKIVLPEADLATDETGCQLHGNATHHAAMAPLVIKGIKDATGWP